MDPSAKSLQEKYQPKEVKVLKAEPQVHSARFSPCGRFLMAGGFDARIRRWDVTQADCPELSPLEGHHGWVQPLAFANHLPRMFSADSWGELRAWTYQEEQPAVVWRCASAHGAWIRDLDVSPDGKLVASCGADGHVRLWSTEEGSLRAELRHDAGDVRNVRFHPSGRVLVSGDDRGMIRRWDVDTGVCVGSLDAGVLHSLSRLQDVGGTWTLGFDETGKYLAVGGTIPQNGGTVQGIPTVLVFEFESGELKHTLSVGAPNDCYVHELLWHSGGFVMAVTSGTPGAGKFLLQRPEDKEPFFVTTAMPNCHSLSRHPDGRRLAIVATNRGSNGNGRQLTKDGSYADNHSPIHLWELPA